eukprot:TRINITY_DN30839_c0_g1_i5.p2 TRINITY_DN30839_c0_g1~~TRINITY_DN30839_c0_g1_i5.p2  ORF type:complete len:163 (+),score=30.15 TRINITY_DN30839_c0_g1_i5:145-633(+)
MLGMFTCSLSGPSSHPDFEMPFWFVFNCAVVLSRQTRPPQHSTTQVPKERHMYFCEEGQKVENVDSIAEMIAEAETLLRRTNEALQEQTPTLAPVAVLAKNECLDDVPIQIKNTVRARRAAIKEVEPPSACEPAERKEDCQDDVPFQIKSSGNKWRSLHSKL